MHLSSLNQSKPASWWRFGTIAYVLMALVLLHLVAVIGFTVLAQKLLHIDRLWLALLIGVGLVWLLRYLMVVHNFYVAARFNSETPMLQHLNWREKMRLLHRESNATIFNCFWSMCQHAFSRPFITESEDLPVLLIHGYICNSGYWKYLSRVLVNEKISHFALDLEPAFAGIDDYAPMVQRAIEALCAQTGSEKVIIVAHSMGGLVARAYLRAYGDAQGGARVARVITVGTPHHGTGLAHGGIGLNAQQMRWHRHGDAEGGASSEWLTQLAAGESATTRALFTSIYSHHDNIVSPQLSSHLPGADNIAFHGVGHVALALDPLVQAAVVREIRRCRSGGG